MTTRNPGKPHDEPQRGAPSSEHEMQAAYHAHTLAQLLYGQLATTHPWMAPMHMTPPAPYELPMMGMHAAPWAVQASPFWGAGPMMGPPMHPLTSPMAGPMMGPMADPFAPMFGYYRFPHR